MNGISRLIVASALIFGVMCASTQNDGATNPNPTDVEAGNQSNNTEGSNDDTKTTNTDSTKTTKGAKKGVNSLHTAVAGIVAMLFIIAA
ncbi:hypothetical protein OCOL_000514 [Ordospora colligata]